ncbi:hypothetical protein ACFQ3Y_24870 [Paenibacillus motobuensis]|uniref:hypothetical protein n=1 Tax=Paenibacillus motobuensis TaxID=295324 RepID=UPI00362D8252
MSAQIIPFPCAANELAAIFEGLADQARARRITGVMFATIGADGDTRNAMTGWYGVGIDDRAALVTHLQFDVIDSFVDEKLSEVDE